LPELAPGLADLGPASALRVTGRDRLSWLQGLATADLRSIPEQGAIQTLFLGPRGKIVSAALVWRRGESLVVTARPDRMALLRAHLDRLLVMEDAQLEPAEGLHRLRWCSGSDAATAAASLRAPAPGLSGLRGSPGPLGLELLVEEPEARALLQALPAPPDAGLLEAWRIGLGVPEEGRDYDDEANPLEAGLDALLSFDKGCYVGQEVVAKATFRGRVAWHLARLVVEGPAPSLPHPLDPARGPRGRVTSAAGLGDRALLLGWVHRERLAPGQQVPLGDGRMAKVLGLPFGSRPGAGQG
jgi:folate-binding protein YgfZ